MPMAVFWEVSVGTKAVDVLLPPAGIVQSLYFINCVGLTRDSREYAPTETLLDVREWSCKVIDQNKP